MSGANIHGIRAQFYVRQCTDNRELEMHRGDHSSRVSSACVATLSVLHMPTAMLIPCVRRAQLMNGPSGSADAIAGARAAFVV
mgnify:CR=1 FL=1